MRGSFAWSNTLNRKPSSYLLDGETRVTNVEAYYGLSERLELGLDIPIIYRGGGLLDQTIDEWHKFFGLPRGDRTKVPDDRLVLRGRMSDGTPFEVDGEGAHFGDVSLHLQYLFSAGDADSPAWAGLFTLRLPTAAENYGQESLDFLIALLGSKRWSRLSSYWGASYLYYLDDSIDKLRFEAHNASAFSSLEYRVSKKLRASISLLYSTSPLREVRRFPDFEIYLDIGVKYPLTEKTILESLIRENLYKGGGTVDITWLIAVSRSFALFD